MLWSYLPPYCSWAQSDEVSLLCCEAIGTYYPHWLIFSLQKETQKRWPMFLSQRWRNGLKSCLSVFILLFWRSHHELCGWHELLQPALSEAAGLRTQPQCTMTCCNSRHADITVQHINIYAEAARCSVSAVLCCQEPHQCVTVHHVFRMKGAYISLSGLQLGQITQHTAVHSCGLWGNLNMSDMF